MFKNTNKQNYKLLNTPNLKFSWKYCQEHRLEFHWPYFTQLKWA